MDLGKGYAMLYGKEPSPDFYVRKRSRKRYLRCCVIQLFRIGPQRKDRTGTL